ncbi:MAG: hypothetical protein COA42_11830 [Alteromonadaceae bacterium]|nr:MAG: hypothetical protein COA42_11830 [Alteromonadaceae bacterium]
MFTRTAQNKTKLNGISTTNAVNQHIINESLLNQLAGPIGLGFDAIVKETLSASIVSAQTHTVNGHMYSGTDMDVGAEIKTRSFSLGFSLQVGDEDIGLDFGFEHHHQKTQSALQISLYSYTQKTNGTTHLSHANLNEPKKQQSSLQQFLHTYGDSYISELTTGGCACVEYRFYCRTIDERNAFSSKLKAVVPVKGVPINTQANAKIANLATEMNIHYSTFFVVSGVINEHLPKFYTLEDKLNFVESGFAPFPLDRPVTLSYALTGYEHLENFNSNLWMSDLGTTPLWDTVKKNRNTAEKIHNDAARSEIIKRQIEWVLKVYQRYALALADNDSKLKTVQKEAQADFERYDKHIQRYKTHPQVEIQPLEFRSISHGYPKLVYQPQEGNQRGGIGGGAFDDVPTPFNLEMHMARISHIQMIGDDKLRCLMIGVSVQEDFDEPEVPLTRKHILKRERELGILEYFSPPYWLIMEGNSAICGREKITLDEFTFVHGEKIEGRPTNKLTLAPGQKIEKICGRSGDLIDQLHIKAAGANGINSGGSGGDVFDWTPGENQCIVGFKGRAGHAIDQLIPVYLQFLPADWI